MGIFNSLKLRKIKKFELLKNAEGIIKLLPRIDDYFVKQEALQALGRIGNDKAIDELIKRFETSDHYYKKDYINALALSNNPKAFSYIRQTYLFEVNHRGLYDSELSEIGTYIKEILLKTGDVDLLMEEIVDQNKYFDYYYKTIKNIPHDHFAFLSDSINKYITDREQLLKILSESRVHAFCKEALKKLKDINKLPEKTLKSIIGNKAIAKDILQCLNNKQIIFELLAGLKYTQKIDKIISVGDSNYLLFDDLLTEIRGCGGTVKYNTGTVACPDCGGKGEYTYTKHNDFLDEHIDKTETCKRCKGSQKISIEIYQVLFNDKTLELKVYRNNNRIDLIV